MKILILDVETSPHLSWHFGRWNQNIPPSATVHESRVICWAAKWFGKKQTYFKAEWEDSGEDMFAVLWELLDEADVVVGYNSDKFDLRRINSEFLRLKMTPPSSYHKVDLFKQIKKSFGFSSNKLDSVLKELGLELKVGTGGFRLWMDVMEGVRAAQRKMKSYNKVDVLRTEQLYSTILGWIEPHPNWGLYVDDRDKGSDPVCPNCGSTDLVRRKIRTTRVAKYVQYCCNSCGKYARGRKNLMKGGTENGVLT